MVVEMFIYQKPDRLVYVIPHVYRIEAPRQSRSIELTKRIHQAMIGLEPRSYEVAKDILTCRIEEDDLLRIAKEFELEIDDLREP